MAGHRQHHCLRLCPPYQIAVEGCCHGDLDKIYATMQHLEKKQNTKIDLLICCGDFQVCCLATIVFLSQIPPSGGRKQHDC